MRLIKLTVYSLNIPFCLPISHNLARRHESEAIVAVAEDETGLKGYGEGTPRSYVTGETLEPATSAAVSLGRILVSAEIPSLAKLTATLRACGASTLARSHPSAFCALELAILDLWGKRNSLPLWRLFVPEPATKRFVYSAVLPMVSDEVLSRLLAAVREMAITFVKVKIDRREEGVTRLRFIRDVLGEKVDMRVDANGAFTPDEAIEFLMDVRGIGISAFEQPVPKDDLAGLKHVADNSSVPVIADESVCTQEEAEYLIRERVCQGFNIRISKCGGLLKSLSLWRKAVANGILCQIGCHVGETAILSAAGRHLAALSPEYAFLEGSFSRFVLREDLIDGDISFGRGGESPLLTGPGLGITVNERSLAKLGERVATVTRNTP
jgi:L-alanine-DL-glutamate epimerase-like enolase superfamily enzyme